MRIMSKDIRAAFFIIFLMAILSATVQRMGAEIVYSAESCDSLSNGNDWSMFQHDPAHSGYTDNEGPHTPNVIWKRQVSMSARYLVAAKGKLFFSSNHLIYCLDENTGNILWSQEVYGSIHATAEYNGKIFLGTFYSPSSNDGLIYCLNETNGGLLWSYNPSESEGDKVYGMTPTDGKIYASFYMASEGSAQIICLNETTAIPLWNYSLDDEEPASSPTIEDDRAFIISYRLEMINETFGVTHSHMHCVNVTTGKLLWKLTLNLGYPMISYPISAAYGNIFVPLSDTKVGCVSVHDGRIIWERNIPQNSQISAFAVAHGKIFVASYRSLDVINVTNGELVWGINGNLF